MRTFNYQLFFGCIGDLLSNESVQAMNEVTQHVDSVNCLAHCLFVAYLTFRICRGLRLRSTEAARGALLHDMFLYDQHSPQYRRRHLSLHPQKALENAESRFALTGVERDAIRSHMWPISIKNIPKSKEAAVVCAADKLCTIAEITRVYDLLGMGKKLNYRI